MDMRDQCGLCGLYIYVHEAYKTFKKMKKFL